MRRSETKTCTTEGRLLRAAVYGIYVLIQILRHIPMRYVSDDRVVRKVLRTESLLERFRTLYQTNGRILTDFLAALFLKWPIWIWKVFDICVLFAIAVLIVHLFTDCSVRSILTVCMLVLLFPVNYLRSAGYIASSTNYSYPVLGLLLVLFPLVRCYRNQKVSFGMLVLAAVGTIYCSNHDQSAVVQIAGLGLLLLYLLVCGIRGLMFRYTAGALVLSLVSYGFMYSLPGHRYRMESVSEMERWFPGYAEWSLTDKIYHGYTSTVANLIFNKVNLFIVFVLLLALAGSTMKKTLDRIISAIPLGVVCLNGVMKKGTFTEVPPYAGKMPELLALSGDFRHIIPLALSMAAVGCIFWSLLRVIEDRDRRFGMVLLMLLASGSRLMMGFSATIYASSLRTFTIFLFILITEILLLLRELWEKQAYTCCWVGIGAIAGLLIRLV